eukprot:Seg511.2 transcript_id=Seg511.2/GoldUCD/mRNA.D3Y31 product="Phosphorylated adapter RNA export protein" protein_id=Seg511.2/GoldUCD/D3Y31
MEVDDEVGLEIGISDNEFELENEDVGVHETKGGEHEGMQMEVEEKIADSLEDSKQENGQGSSSKHQDLREKLGKKRKNKMQKDDSHERDDKHLQRSSNSRRGRGASDSRKNDNKKLFKILHASPDLDPRILGREIAYRLGEPKVGLIANVVKVLGFKVAMEILEDTKKIERKGGMHTADGSRRRMPGGVYIYCLKENGYATKEQVAEIFKDEKERLKTILKHKRKLQNEKKRKELEDVKKLKDRVLEFVNKKFEQGEESTKEHCKEELLKEKNGTENEITSAKCMEDNAGDTGDLSDEEGLIL